MSNDPIEQRARELATVALDTLHDCMVNGSKEDASRVKAASVVLDRGYGKPTQAIIAIPQRNAGSAALAALTDGELLALIGEIRNQRGGRDAKLRIAARGLETACDPLNLTRDSLPEEESLLIFDPGVPRNPRFTPRNPDGSLPAATAEFPFADPLCD
jgi:hypothetical protein